MTMIHRRNEFKGLLVFCVVVALVVCYVNKKDLTIFTTRIFNKNNSGIPIVKFPNKLGKICNVFQDPEVVKNITSFLESPYTSNTSDRRSLPVDISPLWEVQLVGPTDILTIMDSLNDRFSNFSVYRVCARRGSEIYKGKIKESIDSVIFYFPNPNWKLSSNWLLEDLDTHRFYVPENNSLVGFGSKSLYRWHPQDDSSNCYFLMIVVLRKLKKVL